MSRFSLLTAMLALSGWLHAEIRVSTDFEGGNAEVVSLDQNTKTLRIMPKLHEGRGWPCWWYFRLDGLTLGETNPPSKCRRRPNPLAEIKCSQPRGVSQSTRGSAAMAKRGPP